MRNEVSCGIIAYYKHEDGLKFLVLKHGEGHWAFAKGHVEGKETEMETAMRELREETGLMIEPDPNLRLVTNYEPKPGVSKDVVYFCGEAKDMNLKLQAEEISEGQWLLFDEASALITYPSDKALLEEVYAYVLSL
jgi:tRNA nucleotidyltransferase (CCA-adding enzyme)